jgi:hypothetical protein
MADPGTGRMWCSSSTIGNAESPFFRGRIRRMARVFADNVMVYLCVWLAWCLLLALLMAAQLEVVQRAPWKVAEAWVPAPS